MSVVKELIRTEENGSISFGNYMLDTKSKLEDFEHGGDLYKVKTFKSITKLEKNGMFVYESVPGTAVEGLEMMEEGISFQVEGQEDTQITVELESAAEYEVYIDESSADKIKTNLGGKLSFSVELGDEKKANVKIVKVL